MPRLTEPLHPNTYYEDDEQVQFVVTVRKAGIRGAPPCDRPLDIRDETHRMSKQPHRKTQVGILRGAVIGAADDYGMNVAVSGRRGP